MRYLFDLSDFSDFIDRYFFTQMEILNFWLLLCFKERWFISILVVICPSPELNLINLHLSERHLHYILIHLTLDPILPIQVCLNQRLKYSH